MSEKGCMVQAPKTLPDGWRKVKFGDVVCNVNISEHNPMEKGLERFVGLEHIDPGSLQIKRWGMIENGTTFTRKFVKGQVLFGKRRSYQEKLAVADFDVCSGDILVFESKDGKLIPELLPFIVQNDNFFDFAIGTSSGSLSPRTKWKHLASYEFPLPPKDEQRRIADILWAAEECIVKNEKLVEKTDFYKKILMNKLLTKGIGHVKFKDSEVGKIPEEWRVVRMEEVITIHDSKRIPLSEMERNNRKGIYPYCGANVIIDYINDYIFDGEFLLLAEDGGAYGKFENSSYLMNGKFWVNNHAHVISASTDKTINLFLFYSLNFLDLNPYIVGTTRKKLNQDQLRGIKIPLPSLLEQHRITEILSKLDDTIQKILENINKIKALKMMLVNQFLNNGSGKALSTYPHAKQLYETQVSE